MAADRPKGVINLQGRDFPTWPFVLDKAHNMGLIGIETELLETPSEANGQSYIVRAKASFRPAQEGDPIRVFTGLGDAGPKNVNVKIVGATLRMAETRAMGRALRTATNIGETMYEELSDDGEHIAQTAPITPHEHHRRATGSGGSAKAKAADPAPGFEPEFTDGKAKFKREDLIKGVVGLIGSAKTLGLVHDLTDPEARTNLELYEFGREMKKRIHDARDWERGAAKEDAAG